MPIQCAEGRKKSGFVVDYGAGEFLRYKIRALQGAGVFAWVVGGRADEAPQPILDEQHNTSVSVRETDWARSTAPWLGTHYHAVILSFEGATGYKVEITLRNGDGTLKEWIRDCTYTKGSKAFEEFVLTVGVV